MKNAASKTQMVPQRCVMLTEIPNFFQIVSADTTLVMPGGNKFEIQKPHVVVDAAWFDKQTKKNNSEDCFEYEHESGDFCRMIPSDAGERVVFMDRSGVVATCESPARSEPQTISAQISKLEKQKTKLEVELNDVKRRIELLEQAGCLVAVAGAWDLSGLVIEVLRDCQEPVTASDLYPLLVDRRGIEFDGINDPLNAVETVLRRLVDSREVKIQGLDAEARELFVYVGRTLHFHVKEGLMELKGRT